MSNKPEDEVADGMGEEEPVEEDDGEEEEEDDSSSSSGSSIMAGQYVAYNQRPEWADVVPLPQDDGLDPVVRISYSDEFREVFDYIRALIATQEMSLRAFHLTTHALRLNPANYTTWEYRRRLVKALKLDLHTELDHMDRVIEKNAKNYQVWHHRRSLVEWINDCTGELDFVEHIFKESNDWKNFHAWQHRSWVICHFKLSAQEVTRKNELSFTKRLLDQDLRNNSVWNYRMYLLTTCFSSDGQHLPADVLQSEISQAMSYIRLVPDNESAWNYLLGLLAGSSINEQPQILKLCEELHESGRLHQFSLECQVMGIEDKLKCKELAMESRRELIDRASTLLDLLANNVDTIRSRYWNYRKQLITSQ